MERVETKIVKSTETYHTFYCDICGEEICTKKEYDDGYYDRPNFDQYITVNSIPSRRYVFSRDLCESCKLDFVNNLKIALTKLGFESE